MLQFELRRLKRTHNERTRARTCFDGRLRCGLDAVRSNAELEAADVPRTDGRVYDCENRRVGGERLQRTQADDFGEDDLPNNTQK